ncbi:hypothetical protein EX895_000320 [Sporisorium graminicola]|uniref:Chromo domain-containing protein n=1 Tax=Sporisorium graminicola TaxID=280036 RepID=A0A4U7L4F4_9BASI|nr:hypothetical protein EX895_000320 [Sporisorium graminicola]TKY90322.1 hypothetical protein EX895_000320 [Sporisorium graminicola]
MSHTIAGPSNSSLGAAPLSSNDDVQMIDSNGDTTTTTGAAATNGATHVEDGEGDSSDVAEDEYEIESIVSHFQDSSAGELSYFVKWKGYPDSENSWVYESDMGGAQEMITEYWAKVPEKRVKRMGTKGGKKGKRQSSVSASSPAAKASSSSLAAAGKRSGRRELSLLAHGETPSSRTKVARRVTDGLAPSRSPTPDDALIDVASDPALQRIRSDPNLTDEQRQVLEAQHLHAVKLDRLRKRYARIPDWDPIVKRVEAVEKMSDNKLRVFVHFENGDRLAFESIVAHHRCPLKLLQFYESNLRFKKRDDDDERAETMRGEEVMRELDEYTAAQQAGANGVGQGEGEKGKGEAEAQTEGTRGDADMVPNGNGHGTDAEGLSSSAIDSQQDVVAAAQGEQSHPDDESLPHTETLDDMVAATDAEP